MVYPNSSEELATYVEKDKNVFLFMADWCGDCRFIKPVMPGIEGTFPMSQFIEVDRDQFTDVAAEWNIFDVPSFVVIENDQESRRLVNKDRKTKEEISTFLTSLG